MYSGVELTGYAYRAILGHLVDWEENKNELVNEFYQEPSALKDEFKSFIEEYLVKLEELVKSVQIIEKPTREKIKSLNFLPYVIIGSTIELEKTDDTKTFIYKVVSPYDVSNSHKDLSYMSALGRSLLLKRPGDLLKTVTDEAEGLLKIKSIKYEY